MIVPKPKRKKQERIQIKYRLFPFISILPN